MHNYQGKWRSRLAEALGPEGLDDVIGRADSEGLFANWKRVWDPGGRAQLYLHFAIEILCGDPRHPYAPKFLGYASKIAERAYGETERKLPTGDWGNPEGWAAGRRSSLLRVKAITDAIVANTEPDAKLLTEAAQMILDDSRQAHSSRLWTELEKSRCLSAVQLLLITGEIASAKSVFKWRKSFKATQHYHDWLKTFTLALPDEASGVDAGVRIHFDSFFDVVRDPSWICPEGRDSGYNILEDHNILRVQLALIKQRLIIHAPIAGRWDEVIGLIAR
jgi:hypothetical protein